MMMLYTTRIQLPGQVKMMKISIKHLMLQPDNHATFISAHLIYSWSLYSEFTYNALKTYSGLHRHNTVNAIDIMYTPIKCQSYITANFLWFWTKTKVMVAECIFEPMNKNNFGWKTTIWLTILTILQSKIKITFFFLFFSKQKEGSHTGYCSKSIIVIIIIKTKTKKHKIHHSQSMAVE